MKKIITRKVKSNSKFSKTKTYSGFWMNDSNYYNNVNRFSGISDSTTYQSSDMVKVIKLSSYRKAVANFVKIVTKKDIPVIFSGTQSYTDFDKIVLTTDIKDDNFDVTVGLALHEASHIVHTNREYLNQIEKGRSNGLGVFPTDISALIGLSYDNYMRWKSITNWIEDRRIDNIVFKSSPGYKAYYHKLYDYYWNDKSIDKALNAPNAFTDPKVYESYEFRIVNSLNKNAKKDALPGLRQILEMIDIKNISRLQSVEDSGKLAGQVMDVILTYIDANESGKQQQQKNDDQQQQMGGMNGSGEGQPQDDQQSEDTQGADDQQQDNNSEVPNGDQVHIHDMQSARQQLEKQRKFLNGEVKKKDGTSSMNKRLEALKRVDVEMQQVGGTGGVQTYNALIYNLTTNNIVAQVARLQEQKNNCVYRSEEWYKLSQALEPLTSILPPSIDSTPNRNELEVRNENGKKEYRGAVEMGLELGALLGRKLRSRNEVRELVYNRTRTGAIDKKRLAEAGYGVESIFKQIHIDKYKKALIHISLDASGSMSGEKWSNTILMTVAIAKAATAVQNLDVTVDLRCTERSSRTESPVCVILYDSRINKLNHLTTCINHVSVNSMTPEGLCTEALIKRGFYKKSDTTLDTFFLNICDGQPGGITGYDGGCNAIDHTRRQVNTLRNEYNMQILGYFIDQQGRSLFEAKTVEEAISYNSSYGTFYKMYGRGSKYAPVKDMHAIAKHMNDLFMAKACLV